MVEPPCASGFAGSLPFYCRSCLSPMKAWRRTARQIYSYHPLPKRWRFSRLCVRLPEDFSISESLGSPDWFSARSRHRRCLGQIHSPSGLPEPLLLCPWTIDGHQPCGSQSPFACPCSHHASSPTAENRFVGAVHRGIGRLLHLALTAFSLSRRWSSARSRFARLRPRIWNGDDYRPAQGQT